MESGTRARRGPRIWRIAAALIGCAAVGLAAVLITSMDPAARFVDMTTAKAVATPAMDKPGYLSAATDPAFGTRFTRITDPGRELFRGVSCDRAYCTHRYSSSQAWNADQSLLLIDNGCSGYCFLDGHTYKPAFFRAGSDECEWHPTDPALMICVSGAGIYTWAPRTNAKDNGRRVAGLHQSSVRAI